MKKYLFLRFKAFKDMTFRNSKKFVLENKQCYSRYAFSGITIYFILEHLKMQKKSSDVKLNLIFLKSLNFFIRIKLNLNFYAQTFKLLKLFKKFL